MSKLMIKASLGSDIRRVSIHNEELTYDELILMLQRVFRGKLSNEDDILLKYKDEDDDLITIFDSADLAFALEVCPVLKLTLFLNGEGLSEEENGESALKGMRGVQSVKAELRQIRDRVNRLLDYLEDKSGSGPKVEEDDLKTKEASTEDSVNGEQSKEFDPLQGKNVQEDFSKRGSPAAVMAEPTSTVPVAATQGNEPLGPPMGANMPPMGMQPYPKPCHPKPLHHTSAYPQHPSMMPMNIPGPPSSGIPATPPQGIPTSSTGALGPPPTGPAVGIPRIPTSSAVYPPPMTHGMPTHGHTPGLQPGQNPGLQPGQTPGMPPMPAPGLQPGPKPVGQVPGYNPYYKGVPSSVYPTQPGYQ